MIDISEENKGSFRTTKSLLVKPVILYNVYMIKTEITMSAEHSFIHRVPKLAAPLLQTCLTQFVVHGFQRNIVHCTTLTLLTITPIMLYALYCVCSV